jgi:hypothetical protein
VCVPLSVEDVWGGGGGGWGVLSLAGKIVIYPPTPPHPSVHTSPTQSPHPTFAQAGRLFSAAGDNTVYGWDVSAPSAPVARYSGHDGYVHDVCAAPAARAVASASEDGSVKLWGTHGLGNMLWAVGGGRWAVGGGRWAVGGGRCGRHSAHCCDFDNSWYCLLSQYSPLPPPSPPLTPTRTTDALSQKCVHTFRPTAEGTCVAACTSCPPSVLHPPFCAARPSFDMPP